MSQSEDLPQFLEALYKKDPEAHARISTPVIKPSIQESHKLDDNKDMSNAEQYYQKAIDGAFKALDSHIRSFDGHLNQLKWVMGIGVGIISILLGGLYFNMNSGFSNLEKRMDAQAESLKTEVREMDKRWEQRQQYYEKYIDARLDQKK